MNIETANRLYEQRKKMKLSQEELASKIGVSRQAVSKWERAEASPDTDNLIALSKIYGLSLDELILGSNNTEINREIAANENTEKEENLKPEAKIEPNNNTDNEKESISNIIYNSMDDISKNIDESMEALDKAMDGIEDDTEDNTDESSENRKRLKKMLYSFPYPVLATIIFFIYGFTGIGGGWIYGWLVFLTIPLYYTFIPAYFNKNPTLFCYPVLVVWVYMYLGFRFTLWHPMWLLFLTIPLYYSVCSNLRKK